MGEISEMMLDGTLCEECGVYIGEGLGFPELCEDCKSEDDSWSDDPELGCKG